MAPDAQRDAAIRAMLICGIAFGVLNFLLACSNSLTAYLNSRPAGAQLGAYFISRLFIYATLAATCVVSLRRPKLRRLAAVASSLLVAVMIAMEAWGLWDFGRIISYQGIRLFVLIVEVIAEVLRHQVMPVAIIFAVSMLARPQRAATLQRFLLVVALAVPLSSLLRSIVPIGYSMSLSMFSSMWQRAQTNSNATTWLIALAADAVATTLVTGAILVDSERVASRSIMILLAAMLVCGAHSAQILANVVNARGSPLYYLPPWSEVTAPLGPLVDITPMIPAVFLHRLGRRGAMKSTTALANSLARSTIQS